MVKRHTSSHLHRITALEFNYRTMTDEQKTKIITQLRVELQKDANILLAYLHGSFSRNEPFRDIDIALWLQKNDPDLAYHYTINVASSLEGALQIPIDVQVLNNAPLPFRHYILSHSILLFIRYGLLHHQLIDITTRQYFDLQSLNYLSVSPSI